MLFVSNVPMAKAMFAPPTLVNGLNSPVRSTNRINSTHPVFPVVWSTTCYNQCQGEFLNFDLKSLVWNRILIASYIFFHFYSYLKHSSFSKLGCILLNLTCWFSTYNLIATRNFRHQKYAVFSIKNKYNWEKSKRLVSEIL